MPASRHTGIKKAMMAYAATVEHFGSREFATAAGIDARSATNCVSKAIQTGDLFSFGTPSARRYTIHKSIADAWVPPPRKVVTDGQHRRKIGQHFGAIRTVEDVRLRCACDDETGCLLWPGAMSGKGAGASHTPVAQVTVDGIRSGVSLPAFVWSAHKGKSVPKGHFVWRKCGNKRCLEPEHLMCGTRKQYGRWVRVTGIMKGRLGHRLANKRTAIKRAKLTAEVMAQVLASDLGAEHWAEGLGVHPSSVMKAAKRVRAMPNSSVFAMEVA